MPESVSQDRSPAIVIAGMHRSGTSLVASLCQASGIHIGEQLLGARPGNEAGHFEDLDFHHWHERVLRANGLGAEGFVASGRIAVPAALRQEAEELLASRRGLGKAWGWKNPRTTLLLDFWSELLPEAVFLGIVRPPWEVVDSLFRRGDEAFRANPPLALEVWRHYNQSLLSFVGRNPDRTLVCDLHRLIGRPGDLFATLRDRFGIPLTDPPDLHRTELLGKVEPTIIPTVVRQAAPEVAHLHESLVGAAGQDDAAEASRGSPVAPFDAVMTLWADLRAAEAATARATADAVEATRVNARLTADLHQARLAHDEALSRGEGIRIEQACLIAEATELAAARETDVVRLSEELATQRDLSIRLEEKAAALADRVESLQAEHKSQVEALLVEHATRVESLQAAHGALTDALAADLASRGLELTTVAAELDRRRTQAEDDRRALVELRAGLAEREASLGELKAALAATSAESQSRSQALATAEATVEVLRDEVERLEAACRENIRHRRQLDLELVRMARSKSWRLTAPLRNLRRRSAALPARAADRLSRLGRRLWRRLPLGVGAKQRLREFLFTGMPWAFRWTRSYREWQAVQHALAAAVSGPPGRTEGAAATGMSMPPAWSAAPVHHGSAGLTGLRVIAMHLPQFHRIPENDAWWGEGFTEWTNVRRGRPFYAGHEQPLVPHPDIGYYDLLEPGTLERQAELARRYGIHGFCFYYYWFDGRRLLEKPLERLLATGRPDFPFCICWANENWTRAWDGLDREILVAQRHSPDSDARFIRDLLPYLRDRRYIRVEGRPLVVVYRAGLLPDPAATAATWRQICRAEGIGEIHLAAVRSFDKRDPRELGFDAAIQFPPLLIPAPERGSDPASVTDPSFRGALFDYDDAVRFSLAEPEEGFPLYRGVMPSWDNTPRRQERGTAWMHSSPEKYGRWLRETIAATAREQPPERRLVFVNAWNEWAEGAHLEPDARHGYRNLEETAAALGIEPVPPAGTAETAPGERILVLSHDAHLAGAQMVTLRTVQQWRQAGVRDVRIVCVGGGVLRTAFAAAYPTTVLEDLSDEPARREALLAAADFAGRRPSVVYSSTVVNGPVLEWIRHLGMPIVTHGHELQKSIERWAPGVIFEATRRASDLFMAAAPAIRDNLVSRHGIDPDLVQVVPAHIDCDVEPPTADERNAIRRSWNAAPADIVVFGCGTTDWRKGPDLFCEIAARAGREVPGLRFIWAGGDADYHHEWLAERGLADTVQFLGTRGDVRDLLHAADIFLLSSREDPMPLVALEAAATGLPVICFAGAGDIPTFVGDDAGVVVPMEDVAAGAATIVSLAGDPQRRAELGSVGGRRVRATYDSRVVAAETLRLLREAAAGRRRWEAAREAPLVSVIVPNYQHAEYLPQRLESLLAQGLHDIEIILLDDKSDDGSLEILEAFAQTEPRARLIANETNSGSAFRQWRKGLGLARGRYIWIAESDDAARPDLLPTLVALLDRHPGVVLAYCQSEMIDERGHSLGLPLEWTSDLSENRWRRPYVAAGRDELAAALIHKNTIPNVSAVVFRNLPELAEMIDPDMRLCGDWLAYVRLCGRGDVAYSPEPLNLWRQRTSHSRTRPPGEMEWHEGRQVIREAVDLLGLDAEAADKALAAFRQRCAGWLAAAGADLSATEG